MRLGLVAFILGAHLLAGTPAASAAEGSRASRMADHTMITLGAADLQPAGGDEAGTFVLQRKALPAFADTGSSDYVRLLNSEGAKTRGRISGILLMAVPGPVLGASVPVLIGLAGLVLARRRRLPRGVKIGARL